MEHAIDTLHKRIHESGYEPTTADAQAWLALDTPRDISSGEGVQWGRIGLHILAALVRENNLVAHEVYGRLWTVAGMIKEMQRMPVVEASNPGPVGRDTGYEFDDPKTGQAIRVLAKEGESRAHAIMRVRQAHGLR